MNSCVISAVVFISMLIQEREEDRVYSGEINSVCL